MATSRLLLYHKVKPVLKGPTLAGLISLVYAGEKNTDQILLVISLVP